jgi:hypothetical protein
VLLVALPLWQVLTVPSYPGFQFVARPVMGGTFALLIANAQGTVARNGRSEESIHGEGMAAVEFTG